MLLIAGVKNMHGMSAESAYDDLLKSSKSTANESQKSEKKDSLYEHLQQCIKRDDKKCIENTPIPAESTLIQEAWYQYLLRCVERQDPKCISDTPISTGSPWLQGLNQVALSNKIIGKRDCPNRFAMIKALADKFGGVAEWHKKNLNNDNKLMSEAIRYTDVPFIEFLLDNKINPDSENDDNLRRFVDNSSMSKAHSHLIKRFVNAGADINAKGVFQKTPLNQYLVPISVMRVLINNGAWVNTEDRDQRTPLHHSVQEQNKEKCELLLENGALSNKQTSNGKKTPYENALEIETEKCKNSSSADCQKAFDIVNLIHRYMSKGNR